MKNEIISAYHQKRETDRGRGIERQIDRQTGRKTDIQALAKREREIARTRVRNPDTHTKRVDNALPVLSKKRGR